MHSAEPWIKPLPHNLLTAKELVYDKCNYACTKPSAQPEGRQYAAYTFKINGQVVIYRDAKITPTKTGQFVTLWKREQKGSPIMPFEITDNIRLFIISTRRGEQFGQFIFPAALLAEKGIISSPHKEGKRAIRVYPPWDKANNNQAKTTQQWQLKYFLDITINEDDCLKKAACLLQSLPV